MNALVDKALQADQTAKNLKQEAIQSLLKDRQTIADQLSALGYIEGQKPAAAKNAPKPPDPNKVCPVCTEKGHDGRFHRRKDAPKAALAKPAVPSATK